MSSKSKVPTPDEIWKILKKVSVIQEEATKKSKADIEELKAGQKELHAIQKKTELMIQKVGGRFDERWGAMVESLVRGKLVTIFKDQNIDISETHTRSIGKWKQPGGKVKRREFDIVVANGTEAVAVEVKTTLEARDVHYFLDNIKNFKDYFRRYKNTKIYGAVAFLNVKKESDLLAEEKGLFIIRATGDSARLVNQAGFKPKVFA